MKSSAMRIDLARINSFDLSLVCERSVLSQSECKTIALVFGLVFSDIFFIDPGGNRPVRGLIKFLVIRDSRFVCKVNLSEYWL